MDPPSPMMDRTNEAHISYGETSCRFTQIGWGRTHSKAVNAGVQQGFENLYFPSRSMGESKTLPLHFCVAEVEDQSER